MFYKFSNKTCVIAVIFSLLYGFLLLQILTRWEIHKYLLQILISPLYLSIAIPVLWTIDLFTNKKCSICEKTVVDQLIDDGKTKNFCRPHLLEQYSSLFTKNSLNVVMIEYQPKSDSVYTTYLFDPLSEIDWGDQKKVVGSLLETISGKTCKQCKNNASILFIPKEIARFAQAVDLEDAKKGEYLCKTHALRRLLPSLQSTKGSIALYLPFKENGLQATYY